MWKESKGVRIYQYNITNFLREDKMVDEVAAALANMVANDLLEQRRDPRNTLTTCHKSAIHLLTQS